MPDPNYQQLLQDLDDVLPAHRVITDPLRTLAYGSDASFYRLVPKVVLKADNEGEIAAILRSAARRGVPVTFRAAGTSLSGQAVTESVLVSTGHGWKAWEVLDNGRQIRLQPGVIGAHANRCLAPYGRKIGPDPASINAAMIGGIAANNASGMCCGTSQNSYRTVSSLRIIFQDGTLLDTGDPGSRAQFSATHAPLLNALADLAVQVRADTALAGRIRHKYKMKNTTGYSLNALVDFENPFDIITHLMIGSEGTLGFISRITYDTVVEAPHKASSLILFPDIETACSATALLRGGPVAAAELMDRAALRSVEQKAGMPAFLKTLPPAASALLVETRAAEAAVLAQQMRTIVSELAPLPLERPIAFTDRPAEYAKLWDIRKGLFPAVGAVRQAGTTVIIEDVAFPVADLARATLDLQALMARYAYHEAIIFGHALEGNLHFVFTQDFGRDDEVERYRRFMHEVCEMVVGGYDGSLKAEHGTGRNMAPYVEMEWGSDAVALMRRIKSIFDPKNLLNPGVILNDNPQVHIENLKPLPTAHPIVDKCIECGFCESACPSKNLTLTPRQRVIVQREISRLRREGGDARRLEKLEADYRYQGDQTCATDGLCELSCPVDINTGELTKVLREATVQVPGLQKRADLAAAHFASATAGLRVGLTAADLGHRVLGSSRMAGLALRVRDASGNRLPLWNRFMPTAVNGPKPLSNASNGSRRVVYFPSCIARSMGPAREDPDRLPLYQATLNVLRKGGFEVVFPASMAALCCGMPFSSKGYKRQADRKARELEAALLLASRHGADPILFDTSPCLYRMRQAVAADLRLYDPAGFVCDFLLDRLSFCPQPDPVAVHHTCSAVKMSLQNQLLEVARRCAPEVVVPDQVGCCGFAGDRGFTYPELNASALAALAPAVSHCSAGYSTSRTCEIGLSLHSGIFYKSIMYLVDRCTAAQPTKLANVD